jgi:hypothetical protein
MTLEKKLTVEYNTGADGIQYPALEMDTTVQLRKYGQMRLTYLREHKKALYSQLYKNGELMQHCATVEQRAFDMMDRLEAEYRAKNPAPQTDDFMVTLQYNNQVRDYAEELTLAEVVYV